MFMMYFIHNFLTNMFQPQQHYCDWNVMRKLWMKYIINNVVYFVGFFIHIMDLIKAEKTEHIKILYVWLYS